MMIFLHQVVEYDGDILEKPADAEDAFRVLSRLSGSTNRVHTGVVVILPNVTGAPEKDFSCVNFCEKQNAMPSMRSCCRDMIL